MAILLVILCLDVYIKKKKSECLPPMFNKAGRYTALQTMSLTNA